MGGAYVAHVRQSWPVGDFPGFPRTSHFGGLSQAWGVAAVGLARLQDVAVGNRGSRRATLGAGASDSFRKLPFGADGLIAGRWRERELRDRRWRVSDARVRRVSKCL